MQKRLPSFMGLYAFSYMAIGIMMPLIGQYLRSVGFSGTQIGTVTATGTVVAIFSSALWGRIYSGHSRHILIVMFLCIAAAAAACLIRDIYVYAVFIAAYGALYFFQAPVMALSDAMTIEDEKPFGFARMWGAVGFAAGVFFGAGAAEAAGLDIIFFMYACSFMIAAAFIFSIYISKKRDRSDIPAARKKKAAAGGYLELLRNRKLTMLLLSAFFLCGTNVANNTYFSFLYIDGGGTLAGVGAAFLLMAGSEAPFMAWTDALSRKFTMEKLILMSMILSVIRFAWYGTGPCAGLLLVFFFLQGMVNGVILVEFVRYVSKLVDPCHRGMAISVYYAFSSSCSTILCQFAGGIVLDSFGPSGVYLFFSLYNLAGVMLYIVFGLYRHE